VRIAFPKNTAIGLRATENPELREWLRQVEEKLNETMREMKVEFLLSNGGALFIGNDGTLTVVDGHQILDESKSMCPEDWDVTSG
jgi:hypothetical protein